MYKVIQLTNPVVGAVEPAALVPLGAITRRYGCRCNDNCNVFEISTTGSNTVTINEEGYYDFTYTGSLVAGAAGLVRLNLLVNGVEVLSMSQTAAAAGDTVNITIPYVIRVLPNCNACVNNSPAIVQLQLDADSVALTGGTSNLIIEKTR